MASVEAAFVVESLEPKLILSGERHIATWVDIKESLYNRVIGVFGGSGSGKPTIVASLIYELDIENVILLSNDPNPTADLGQHLPSLFVRNFREEGPVFLTKIANVQQTRQKYFNAMLKSESFENLFVQASAQDPEILKIIANLEKSFTNKITKKTKGIVRKIEKCQIEEQLKWEWKKDLDRIKMNAVRSYVKKNRILEHPNNFTSVMQAFLRGNFLSPKLMLVLDDFGQDLVKCPEMNMLVTFSRKLSLTIIIIAQSPRDVSSSIRDNMSFIIPTTQNATDWCVTYMLRWGNELSPLKQSMEDIFDSTSFHAPLISIHRSEIFYIATSVWGVFKLGSFELVQFLDSIRAGKEKLDVLLLKLAGLKYMR